MPSDNKIVLASAGSGKTTTIIDDACTNSARRTALITYTLNGRDELAAKAYQRHGTIPHKVKIDTWYSFVLANFIRPYQNYLYDKRISTINFDNVPLALRKVGKSKIKPYFVSGKDRLWRDRVTDFACQLIIKSKGLPLRRLEKIYSTIYIDEAQDLSGWDLELVELLLVSEIKIILVGDHRQATFSTNNNIKNKAYWGEKIIDKFCKWEKSGLVSLEHQNHSYRCIQQICDFADKFFPNVPQTESKNENITDHDGVFFIEDSDVENYLMKYTAQPLRYDRKTKIEFGNPLNFGEAKGMTFERVIIYPHGPLKKYLQTGQLKDAGKSLAKIYVAITRARQSVVVVVPDGFKSAILDKYNIK